MAGTIPRTRLGRALKAGIPIALIIAGAELLEGRLTIQREGGQLTLTASPIARPERIAAVDVVRRAKSCIPAKKGAGHSDWTGAIMLPIAAAIGSAHHAIDTLLGIVSFSRPQGSSAHFSRWR